MRAGPIVMVGLPSPLRYNAAGDLLMAKRTNRVAWGLAAVLVVTLLGACGVGGVWLHSYWVAKHYGPQADLPGGYGSRSRPGWR